MQVSGVVLAAGRGERFGGHINKVWREAAGRPLAYYAVNALWSSGVVDELVMVVRPEDEEQVARLAQALAAPVECALGGARRQDSARAGVEAARGQYVLVHDGARPLVGRATVEAVLDGARRYGAAVPVLPVVDTLRYLNSECTLSAEGPLRKGLVQVQTPQGFRRDLLLNAYRVAEAGGCALPDDAAAVLLSGQPVAVVPGDPANIKVTRQADAELVRHLLLRGC